MTRTLLSAVFLLTIVACLVAVAAGLMYFAQLVLLVFAVLFTAALVKGFQHTDQPPLP